MVGLLVAHAPCFLRKVDHKGGEFVLVGTCIIFSISDQRLNESVKEGAQEVHDILLV